MARGVWAGGYQALIQWAFARFYNEFAWSYDTVAWLVSRGLWQQWTLAALPYLHGTVLELGCGTGYVQHALAATHRTALTVGLDASRSMLALTRRRAQRAGHAVVLVRGRAQRLPFRAGAFQSVLSTFPSEYILHPETLRDVARVLAPDGRLVIVDSAQFASDGPYERAVDLAYRLTFQRSVVRDVAAMSPYTSILERAGFAVALHPQQVGASHVMVIVGSQRVP